VPYAVGVRSRWWWGDVDHLIARFRSKGDDSLDGQLPSRWRALVEFFTWHSGFEREEIFRASDPRPFLRETRRWLSRA
jgi:hypothetical protein